MRLHQIPRLAFAGILASAMNCSNAAQEQANAKTAREIKDLKEAVDSLSSAIETEQLERYLAGPATAAFLRIGSDGYQIVATDVGPLIFSIRDIRPFANGSRLTLRIGNPSGAALTELKFDVEWGSMDTRGRLPDTRTQHSTQYSVPDRVAAGSWHDTQVTLDAVPNSQLGFVRIKNLDIGGLSLKLP